MAKSRETAIQKDYYLPFTLSSEILHALFISPMRVTHPDHLLSFDLITLIIGEQ
jgi:hypothetical protein